MRTDFARQQFQRRRIVPQRQAAADTFANPFEQRTRGGIVEDRAAFGVADLRTQTQQQNERAHGPRPVAADRHGVTRARECRQRRAWLRRRRAATRRTRARAFVRIEQRALLRRRYRTQGRDAQLRRSAAAGDFFKLRDRLGRKLIGQRAQRVEHRRAMAASHAAVTARELRRGELVDRQAFRTLRVHAGDCIESAAASTATRAADPHPAVLDRGFELVEPLGVARQQVGVLAFEDA